MKKAKKQKPPAILFVDLGLNATNEDIAEQMRIMRRGRTSGRYSNVVCVIRGFDDDKRELHEVPEVRAFCRRLVSLGFISYLDFTTARLPMVPKDCRNAWAAVEVWLCAEGRMFKDMPLTVELAKEGADAWVACNDAADKLIGPYVEPS